MKAEKNRLQSMSAGGFGMGPHLVTTAFVRRQEYTSFSAA